MGLKRLEFVPPNRSPWENKGVMLTLSVAKLDLAWYYNRVPPGGNERMSQSITTPRSGSGSTDTAV